MHLPIRDDRNTFPAPRTASFLSGLGSSPSEISSRVLFESSQFFSFELEIDLFEFSLCRQANREVLIFERDCLFVFDQRLPVDSEKSVFQR
jgi:hypothetical protein